MPALLLTAVHGALVEAGVAPDEGSEGETRRSARVAEGGTIEFGLA